MKKEKKLKAKGALRWKEFELVFWIISQSSIFNVVDVVVATTTRYCLCCCSKISLMPSYFKWNRRGVKVKVYKDVGNETFVSSTLTNPIIIYR